MRIAINARSILKANRTGIGRYTYYLLDSLGEIDHKNEYWLYARKNFWDSKRQLPQFSFPHFKVKLDFLNRGIASLLKEADVYHSPSPDGLNIQGLKIIVTVHDLIYKTYPQSHTQETIDLTEQYMHQIVKKADHVICVSENTREDLHRFYNFPKEKSSVVYNGVDHKIFYKLDLKQRQQDRKSTRLNSSH